LSTQNQDSSRTSSRKSLSNAATRPDKTYPLTPPGSSLGMGHGCIMLLKSDSVACPPSPFQPSIITSQLGRTNRSRG
ncbi:hypothetical protein LEMLEM_LOCUS25159, partial [Lemmus lemmus]